MQQLYSILAITITLLAYNDDFTAASGHGGLRTASTAKNLRTTESNPVVSPLDVRENRMHVVPAVPHNIVATPHTKEKKINSQYYNNGLKQRLTRFIKLLLGFEDGTTHAAVRR